MEREIKKPIPSPHFASEQSTQVYEIRVMGSLDRDFGANCFSGMEFSFDPERSETLLQGPIADRSELYGLLFELCNASLVLTSVRRL